MAATPRLLFLLLQKVFWYVLDLVLPQCWSQMLLKVRDKALNFHLKTEKALDFGLPLAFLLHRRWKFQEEGRYGDAHLKEIYGRDNAWYVSINLVLFEFFLNFSRKMLHLQLLQCFESIKLKVSGVPCRKFMGLAKNLHEFLLLFPVAQKLFVQLSQLKHFCSLKSKQEGGF